MPRETPEQRIERLAREYDQHARRQQAAARLRQARIDDNYVDGGRRTFTGTQSIYDDLRRQIESGRARIISTPGSEGNWVEFTSRQPRTITPPAPETPPADPVAQALATPVSGHDWTQVTTQAPSWRNTWGDNWGRPEVDPLERLMAHPIARQSQMADEYRRQTENNGWPYLPPNTRVARQPAQRPAPPPSNLEGVLVRRADGRQALIENVVRVEDGEHYVVESVDGEFFTVAWGTRGRGPVNNEWVEVVVAEERA
jgi:hypothetical protein